MVVPAPSRSSIRRRTGCTNCRRRRKKCDEKQPECLGCVRRGIKCSGYDRPIVFKDVSEKAAESSKKFEAARWAELRLADQRQTHREAGSEDREKPATPLPSPGREDHESDELNDAVEDTTSWAEGHVDDEWLNSFDSLQQSTFDMALDFLDGGMLSSPPDGQIITAPKANGLASDVPVGKFQNDWLGPRDLTLNLDVPSPVQDPTATADNGAETSSYRTPSEEPPAIDSQTTLIRQSSVDQLAICDPYSALPRREPIRTADNCFLSAARTPLLAEMSLTFDETLALHFREQVAPRIPVDLEFPSLFNASRCFRAAALALSASSMALQQGSSADVNAGRSEIVNKGSSFYYNSALYELEECLKRPQRGNEEEIASTYLLLAYHDMEVNSPLGVRYYGSRIDEMVSRAESETYMSPGLFKAWRMLRCERRFLSLATRATTSLTDAWEACSSFDHQLAIKDILVSIWKLHSRHAMEASFPPRAGASASEQAGQWLRSVLNRDCDHQQAEQGDFNKEDLDAEAILNQCKSFDRQLDQWHCMLSERDLPVPKLRSHKDIVTGPSFDPFIAYRLPEEDKAINYVMYLVARMTSSFLRSSFESSASAMVSETFGRMALGIICGMNLQKRYFSMLGIHNLLLMIVLLGEGITLSTVVLDHLIPRVTSQALPVQEKALWRFFRAAVSLIANERLRGKAIRFVIDGSDGSHRAECLIQHHALAAFGDYNGRGYFHEVFPVQP